MLKQVWWGMIIWIFIKCACSSLYLFFLHLLVFLPYSQKCWSQLRNVEQKKKIKFSKLNFELQKSGSKNTQAI